MRLSKPDARRLLLSSQGLDQPGRFGLGLEGSEAAIRRLGYLQIDTISVVPRAHHHILWSRVSDYAPHLLHELQTSARIFEYWSHAAAYLPIEDYRFALPRMQRIRKSRHWFEKDEKVMRSVLARVKREGPLQARDFEAPLGTRSGPWFDWKPAKKALETLFHEGRLVIRERRGFQKVYDVPERVFTDARTLKKPTEREFFGYLIRAALDSGGFTTARQAAYLRQGLAAPMARELSRLAKAGELQEIEIEGLKDKAYTTANHLARLDDAHLSVDRAKLLSPFDNLLIQRARLASLFDFDYQIECYVPAPKRKFGYFSLPVLIGDRMIGRIDAKADRASRVLILRHVSLENFTEAELPALAQGLGEYREFCACDEIVVERVSPTRWKRLLRGAMKDVGSG